MKANPSSVVEDAQDEIAALVRQLQETQQRLQELTGGQVDAVVQPGGEFFLLHEAQEKLRLSEEALRRQTAEMKIIFDLIPAMIWVKDTHNGILRINEQAAKATGMPVELLEGKSMLDIYPREAALYYVDDLEVISTGKPKLGIVEKLRNPEGMEIWIQTDKVPVHGHNGEVTGIVVMSQDITERKRSEARFRLLVDSNAQGVFFWNFKGKISGSNDAFLKIVRHTREDLEAGRISLQAMTPPEYAPLDRLAREQLTETRVCTPYEKEYILKDGSRVPILIGAAMFEDDPTEGVCFIIDLTERKKLEQQFLRAQRMESIGTLAGGIAHDLNNILAPIMMSIGILKVTATDAQAKCILETIELSAKRGADIVRQVLSFARGMEGERMEVQPKHLLQDIEAIIKDTFPKNINREFSLPNNLWKILGDPTQLHQILLNLCVNARDAMPDGGKLTIAVENVVLDKQYASMQMSAKAGKYVCINVTDSGSGIPPAILEKIFEPFFTTKEVGKGTGLGLSTVMAIVKSHGGFISAYSEIGKGTTFKVYLPATEASSEEKRDTLVSSAPPRGNGETILLVDDEASILAITSQTLEAFGYRTLLAADGAEAVGLYAQHRDRIAVVLTDMAMPIMDGATTIRALKKINPTIKIIAASGLTKDVGMTKMSGDSMKYFLTKPYTAGTLLNAVRAILDE